MNRTDKKDWYQYFWLTGGGAERAESDPDRIGVWHQAAPPRWPAISEVLRCRLISPNVSRKLKPADKINNQD